MNCRVAAVEQRNLCCDVSDDLQAPIYDFKVSKRVGYKTVKVPASRVVIVEGIYALSARIRLRPISHHPLTILPSPQPLLDCRSCAGALECIWPL